MLLGVDVCIGVDACIGVDVCIGVACVGVDFCLVFMLVLLPGFVRYEQNCLFYLY